ncbi:hypothetical protein BGW38_009463, partial [Lunasporangiospora selenospora]
MTLAPSQSGSATSGNAYTTSAQGTKADPTVNAISLSSPLTATATAEGAVTPIAVTIATPIASLHSKVAANPLVKLPATATESARTLADQLLSHPVQDSADKAVDRDGVRPDSPTSLEDSSSDRGRDSFSSESASYTNPLESLNPGPSHSITGMTSGADSRQAIVLVDQNNMTVHLETPKGCSNPISSAQVATPPLSPIKRPQDIGQTEENVEEDEITALEYQDAQTGSDTDSSSTLPPAPAVPTSTALPQGLDYRSSDQQNNSALDCISGDGQMERSTTPPLEPLDNATLLNTVATATSAGPAAAVTTPQHNLPQSVPKASAWSTLLPGVSPIPLPRPPSKSVHTDTPANTTPRMSQQTRAISKELRLHEMFPIVLPPESEAKLTMEMIDLFETLLPTEESHMRRTMFVKKIENIIQMEWPGQDIQANPFGSTVNDLGTSSSDVDICITTTWPGLKNVQLLANAFRKHGMQKVFCVPRAKVPIVKLWDPELHLSCDMNINTPLGLMNTRMIKTYVAIDPRVRPFAMIIKHWARRRVLNDAANGGTISTYTWICIVLNFLQMRSPPILPVLHKIPHTLSKDNQVVNNNNTSFCDDIEKFEGFGLANKETLGGLLYAFFRRQVYDEHDLIYAIEYDYDHHVISVREGCYLTKESKGWHIPGKQYKLFCVEEPFDTSRNLGNSSDMASSKGLREEFRRALDILHQKSSLNLCCAQWAFPPSYYYTNNVIRKGPNGTMIAINNNNYSVGRRYGNGYRTNHYYYNYNQYYDEDYDDYDDDMDEGDEGEDGPEEISVMETLNIGTRPRSSNNPISGSNSNHQNTTTRNRSGSSSRRTGGEGHRSGSFSHTKDESLGEQANQGSSRNRGSRPSKGSAHENTSDPSRPNGSNRSKQDKSHGSSNNGPSRPRKSSSNSQKGGRSGGNSGGNGGNSGN